MQEKEESRAKLDTKTEGESFGNMVPTQKRFFFGGDVRFPGKIRFKRLLPLSIFPPKELSGFPYKSRLLGGFRCCCCQKSFWGFGKKKKKGTICVAMYSKLRDFGFCTLASCAAKSEKGLFTMFPSFSPLPNCSKHLPRKKRRGPFQYVVSTFGLLCLLLLLPQLNLKAKKERIEECREEEGGGKNPITLMLYVAQQVLHTLEL